MEGLLVMTIRPFTPDDYPAVVRLHNAENARRPASAETLQEMDVLHRMGPSAAWLRLVAEEQFGGVIGYAEAFHSAEMAPGHFYLYTTVRQDCRNRGLGSRLLAEAERWALAHGAGEEFSSRMRSDDHASFAWANRRGYERHMDRTEAVLDLATWEAARFAGHVESVRDGGLSLSLTERPLEADLQAMYAVEAATAPDIPGSDGMSTWEQWSARFRPGKAPRVFAIALSGPKAVGWSVLSLPQVEGAGGHTNFTGVLREYRGRGIALALKLLTIESARARGLQFLTTTNDLENGPMLAVNAKLGYRNLPGPRLLKKSLS